MIPVLVFGAIVAVAFGTAGAFFLGYLMGRKDKIMGALSRATPK